MVKTFKRIAALAMAIALVVCFAVSASADVIVNTTTTYADDTSKVNVSVKVSGATDADSITYYAENNNNKLVYIDQTTVDEKGEATFNFQTLETNLMSEVRVGYTGGDEAIPSDVTARTVSYDGEDLATLPTEEPEATVIISNYEPTSGHRVKAVTATGAEVIAWSHNDNNITVTLSTFTENEVELFVEAEEASSEDSTTCTMLDAACITDVDQNLMFTVLGAATRGAREYGVIITTGEIKAEYNETDMTNLKDGFEAFQAKTSNDKGAFAVQVIDEGEGDALFTKGEYNTAIYVRRIDGTYITSVRDEKVVIQ